MKTNCRAKLDRTFLVVRQAKRSCQAGHQQALLYGGWSGSMLLGWKPQLLCTSLSRASTNAQKYWRGLGPHLNRSETISRLVEPQKSGQMPKRNAQTIRLPVARQLLSRPATLLTKRVGAQSYSVEDGVSSQCCPSTYLSLYCVNAVMRRYNLS
jgi:hypothetical protein